MTMHKHSNNCDLAGGRDAAYMTLSGPNVLQLRDIAKAHGIEWHHAAGHNSGRQVIAFFPKNADEIAAVNRLAEAVDQAAMAEKAKKEALKKAGLPTSKAALWRHLESNGDVDHGFGCVDYKIGKYGPFVPGFGEPDGRYYFDSEALATAAKKLLKL